MKIRYFILVILQSFYIIYFFLNKKKIDVGTIEILYANKILIIEGFFKLN